MSGARSNTARTAERAESNQLRAVTSSATPATMLLQPSTREVNNASRSIAPPLPPEVAIRPGTDVERVEMTALFRSGFASIDSPRMANPT